MKLFKRMAISFGMMFSVSMVVDLSLFTVLAAIEQEAEEEDGSGGVLLDAPEKAWWSSPTVARWKSVKAAKQYQVKLYEYGGLESAVVTIKVSSTSYDFSNDMEDGKQYYFLVRSVPKVSETQVKTGSAWTLSEEGDSIVLGDTSGSWRYYLEGSRYQMEDGSYAVGWLLIRGSYYCFDEAGYVVRNTWFSVDDQMYYLTEDGSMQTGWFEWNGSWYYFSPDGKMQTGWVSGNQPNERYYLNQDGTMAYDTVIDGYTLDSGGLAH